MANPIHLTGVNTPESKVDLTAEKSTLQNFSDIGKQVAQRIYQITLKVLRAAVQVAIQAKEHVVRLFQYGFSGQKQIYAIEAQFKAKEQKIEADMAEFLAAQKQQILANCTPPNLTPVTPAIAPVNPAVTPVTPALAPVQGSVIAALNQKIIQVEVELAQNQEELGKAQNESALCKEEIQKLRNEKSKLQATVGDLQLQNQKLQDELTAAKNQNNAASPLSNSGTNSFVLL